MNAFRSILAAGALVLLVTPAGAALCVKRTGAVVAREACKSRETVLSADVFAGSPGPAGAKGDKGDKGDPSGFPVTDSTGKKIAVIDAYSYTTVAVQGGILSIELGPDGFEPYNNTPYLYHEGTNCSGAAFVERYIDDGFVQYPGVFSMTAYYAGTPVTEHTFNSYEYPTPTCATGLTPRGFCCENYQQPYTYTAGPVQTFDLFKIGTPPFTVVK